MSKDKIETVVNSIVYDPDWGLSFFDDDFLRAIVVEDKTIWLMAGTRHQLANVKQDGSGLLADEARSIGQMLIRAAEIVEGSKSDEDETN